MGLEATHPILIVDDARADVLLLQRMLKRAGLTNPIRAVQDGEQAIAYLSGSGEFGNRADYPLPSIVFLDLKMPRCDGFEVLQWISLQPHFSDLMVVVLSKLDDVKDITRAYKLGARSYLIKPTTLEEIKNLISFFHGFWDSGATRRHERHSYAETP